MIMEPTKQPKICNPLSKAPKAYLAAIVESSGDAIISKGLNGIITSWNTSAKRIFGYNAGEAIGKHISLIIPQDHLPEEEIIIAKLAEGQKIEHYETVRRAKNGTLLDVSITVSPIHDSKGRIIGVSIVARDITERKRQEDELRAQQEWFQVTLASIGDAVIATDVNARITYLNATAERLTGWFLKEAVNQPLDTVLKIINEDTRLSVDNPISKALKTGAVQGLANHTVLIAKDGTEYSIEDSAAPIRLSNGKFIGVILVFHDIGDRRIMEKELQKKAEMLAEKDRRKDEFLAMLAHELRNPLAPVSNALHIMRSQPLKPETQKEVLDMATHQVNHIVRLLDDLLDISRITHGKILMQKERIDLCGVARNAIDSVEHIIHERGHTLEVHLPPCPLWVTGDDTRLSQLFGNLLNNAAKYMRDGGRIVLEGQERGAEIIIRVRDTGIGISQEELPHIFDMFMQADTSMERSEGGLGIGLTLVKRIAELHGGKVEVKSEKGQGTEFTVTLPAAESLKQPGSETGEEQPAHPLSSFRVLVVDDNEASARTMGWMLEALGYQAQAAYNAKDALEIAHNYKPDVILLDIGMPDMNGYTLCGRMREDTELKHTIFIAQTGWSQEQHLQRSKEAGFDYHLVKPIRMEVLQQQLKAIKEKAAPIRKAAG